MNDIAVIVVGVVVLGVMGFGCREFFINTEINLALRILVGGIGVGVLILVIRLVRARLNRNKNLAGKENHN